MQTTATPTPIPSDTPARPHTGRARVLEGPVGLVLSLVLVAAVAVVGGTATATGSDSWYRTIEKPPWNPPDGVFGPVWSVLYVLMAVAAWLVARRGLHRRDVKVALGAYLVQLALNLAWSLVFFGMESPGGGLVLIAALLVALGVTILRFRPLSRAAALLLVPYLAWVAFAATLNAGVLILN